MKPEQVKEILLKNKTKDCPSRWELDNIIWADRTTSPEVLSKFLERIDTLISLDAPTASQLRELEILTEFLEDIDELECEDILNQTEEESKDSFIEDLARKSAIEVLTNGKMSFNNMTIACKLSPNDFILCAKRTQDIIKAIHGLVIKGETLSNDVAGA